MPASALSARKEGKRGNPSLRMVLFIIIVILSLDRITKIFIEKYLLLSQSNPVIPGVFHITLVHNRGAAFGILKNQTALFIAVSAIAIISILLALRDKARKKNAWWRVSLSLVLAGAIGNLIDRLSFGHVIDFLDFRIWPVFNIADSAITIGMILLGWQILRR